MQVAKGDYIVARVGEKEKPTLLKVRKIEWPILAIVPDAAAGSKDETKYRIKQDEMIAVLGDNPHPGTAFGVKIEPLFRIDTVKRWGNVYVHRNMDRHELEPFYDRLTYWGKELNRRGLLYPEYFTEIRPERGKYAGTYHYRPQEEEDIVTFHPSSFEDADYVITHEMGHNFWFRKASKRVKAKWIKLYHEHVNVQTWDERAVKKMLKDIGGHDQGNVKDFISNLDETEVKLAEDIFAWVSKVHHLKRDDLDMLLSAKEVLSDYLPAPQEIMYGEVDPPVSEYAGKAPKELFAESFSGYVRIGEKRSAKSNNLKLPDPVKDLMQKTLGE